MRIRDVSEIELKKIRLEGDPDLVFLSSEPFPFKEDAFEMAVIPIMLKLFFRWRNVFVAW
jgi:hypothetical protein